ncbi:MAG: arginine--tRNA ligase, partial [Flavobacteriaceae bacterium]|nr:arginine--tRNA ligase [Flavobacteriaceae bacterium]
MQIIEQIKSAVKAIFLQSFQAELETVDVVWTKKGQEGDFTVHVFPMLRYVKMNPQSLSEQIGKELLLHINSLESFDAIKGFLNLKLKPEFWLSQLHQIMHDESFGHAMSDTQQPAVMVEYSSPNTNKPLHLGH